ncbi:MAG: glycogen(starch) synthase [Rhodothermales bacterium]|jgi:glycogen(starch) synthase
MSKDLRVLQLGSGLFPSEIGGLERVTTQLAEVLPMEGVDLTSVVVTDTRAKDLPPNTQSAARPGDSWYARAMGLRRVVRAWKQGGATDLVSSHFAPYLLPVLPLLAGVPIVIHFHGPWAEESLAAGSGKLGAAGKRAMEQLAYRGRRGYVVLSSAFRDLLVEKYGVTQDLVHVVPGAVLDRMLVDVGDRQTARDELGWSGVGLHLVTVRRLTPRTGVDRLIEAVATLPTVQLHVIGDGEMREALGQMAERIPNVHMVGSVSERELGLAFRAADLSVMPTIGLEGFGLSILESYSAGTPVLVTPIGGMPDIVTPLSPQLVMSDATTKSMRDSLKAVVQGDTTLPDATACREHVRRYYTWSRAARTTADLYRALILRG